jgi:hypothetical protein
MGFSPLESLLNNYLGLQSDDCVDTRITEVKKSLDMLRDWRNIYITFSDEAGKAMLALEKFNIESRLDQIMFGPITNSEALATTLTVVVKARNMLKSASEFGVSVDRQITELEETLEKLMIDKTSSATDEVNN